MKLLKILLFLTILSYPFQDKSILIPLLKGYYIAFILTLQSIFVFLFLKKKVVFSYLQFYFPIFPLIIWISLSTIWSVNYNDSIYAAAKYFTYLIIGMTISYYLIITRNYKSLLSILYFSAITISLIYLFVFFKNGGLSLLHQKASMESIAKIASINVGFGGGRNLLASWISFAMTLSFPILISKKNKEIYKLTIIPTSVVILIAILLTLSRTALLSLFLFFILSIVILQDKKTKKKLKLIFLFAVLLLMLILTTNIFNIGNFLETRFLLIIDSLKGTNIDYGTSGRFELWYYAFKSFYENIFTGTGIGTLYKGMNEIGGVHNYHNVPIQFLAQTGIIGFILFVFWSFWLIYSSYKNFKYFINTELSLLSSIVLINIIVYYFKSLLMFQYYDMEIWILIGFSATLYYWRKNSVIINNEVENAT